MLIEHGSRVINPPEVIKEHLKRVENASKVFPWWEILSNSNKSGESTDKELTSGFTDLKLVSAEDWDISNTGPLLIP